VVAVSFVDGTDHALAGGGWRAERDGFRSFVVED
jgi:hypothetical protein